MFVFVYGEVKVYFLKVQMAAVSVVPAILDFLSDEVRLLYICIISVMTHCQDECRSLSGGVPKNLTLHWMKKIFFSFYHHKEQIRSFPTMYSLVRLG